MMKNSENPLAILGLDRQLVKSLSNIQLGRVIQSQYRILQQLFHPDHQGGSTEKSATINWAKDQLSTPVLLKAWKEQYVGGIKRNKLLEEVESLRSVNDQYLEYYWYPITRRLIAELAAGRFTNLLGLGQTPLKVVKLSKGGMDETMGIELAIIRTNSSTEDRKKARQKVKMKNVLTLKVSEDGVLLAEDFEGKQEPFYRLPVGVIKVEDILCHSGGQSLRPHDFIVALYEEFYPRKKLKHLLLTGELSRRQILTAIPAEVFKPALRFLHPDYPQKSEYLITSSVKEDSLFFHIEGVVRSLEDE